MRSTRSLLLVIVAATACAAPHRAATSDAGDAAVTDVGRAYVRLVLALEAHDPGYVDAYYGPAEVRHEVVAEAPGLATIRARAVALEARLAALAPAADQLAVLRRLFLGRQLSALVARVDMLQGAELGFDDESRLLYDAVAPRFDEATFAASVARLDGLLPGDGPIAERYEAYRQRFVVPPDRVEAVVEAAVEACRERTVDWLVLPPGESFTLELVRDQPWGAYNWYQGSYHSLIQVNTDLPVYLDRTIGLAGHEGYPGHHAYNALLEQRLVSERGWPEFEVYPLYSPQSLIAEGTANVGVDLVFPRPERLRFEHDVLTPVAGIGPWDVALHAAILDLKDQLQWAGTEAARRFLEGALDGEATVAFLERYALMSPERARQHLRFIQTYRSYVINYTLGERLVTAHLDAVAGADGDARRREFSRLLTTPQVASTLIGTASDARHRPEG